MALAVADQPALTDDESSMVSSPRLLLYSHDTFGLGHLRRSLKIAEAFHSHLPSLRSLLLTGSPVAGQFRKPQGLEVVELPAVVKVGDGVYRPRSDVCSFQEVWKQRQNLVFDTVQAFKPHVVLVDHSPTGMKGELLKTLVWLRSQATRPFVVLGLRDVLDEPEKVRADWASEGVYAALECLYDRIFIYGTQAFFDPVSEYRFSQRAREKTAFTGFILEDRAAGGGPEVVHCCRDERDSTRKIFVTLGGGEDGEEILAAVLEMIARYGARLGAAWSVVTGPFLQRRCGERMRRMAAALGVDFETFIPDIAPRLRAADLVIAMGGYNTVTEILMSAAKALIVARVHPRKEQLVRAQRLSGLGLLDHIAADQVTPAALYQHVAALLADRSQPLASARQRNLLPMDGAERLVEACAPLFPADTRGTITSHLGHGHGIPAAGGAIAGFHGAAAPSGDHAGAGTFRATEASYRAGWS